MYSPITFQSAMSSRKKVAALNLNPFISNQKYFIDVLY